MRRFFHWNFGIVPHLFHTIRWRKVVLALHFNFKLPTNTRGVRARKNLSLRCRPALTSDRLTRVCSLGADRPGCCARALFAGAHCVHRRGRLQLSYLPHAHHAAPLPVSGLLVSIVTDKLSHVCCPGIEVLGCRWSRECSRRRARYGATGALSRSGFRGFSVGWERTRRMKFLGLGKKQKKRSRRTLKWSK